MKVSDIYNSPLFTTWKEEKQILFSSDKDLLIDIINDFIVKGDNYDYDVLNTPEYSSFKNFQKLIMNLNVKCDSVWCTNVSITGVVVFMINQSWNFFCTSKWNSNIKQECSRWIIKDNHNGNIKASPCLAPFVKGLGYP